MSIAVSVFSNRRISEAGFQELMDFLKAERDEYGWELKRDDRSVFIEIGTEDIPDLPDDVIADVAGLLGAVPRSRVVLMFNDFADDRMEYRMARAVAIAMAEQWPVVWDNHAGDIERIYPPGGDPSYN